MIALLLGLGKPGGQFVELLPSRCERLLALLKFGLLSLSGDALTRNLLLLAQEFFAARFELLVLLA
jgi:hypothetical protein